MPSPPATNKRRETGRVTSVLEYEVITPMMGGGSKTREADGITTVRASSVLGQLRFWWRACKANAFADLRQLKSAEDGIWGTMSRPSQVELRLDCHCQGTKRKAITDREVPGYVAFPLQRQRDGTPEGDVVKGIKFCLRINYPRDLQDQVEAALWAWTLFGGVGGRTRRGFGALALLDGDLGNDWQCSTPSELPSKLQSCWSKYVAPVHADLAEDSLIRRVPRLAAKFSSQKFAVSQTSGDPVRVWEPLISILREIRQIKKPGTTRSAWPEADAIRKLNRGQPLKKYVDTFPRAYYGLPIVFQFKENNSDNVTLQGYRHKRRASPLILKPLALRGGKAVGFGLVLLPSGLAPGDSTDLLGFDGQPSLRIENAVDWKLIATQTGVGDFWEGDNRGPFAPILSRIFKIGAAR